MLHCILHSAGARSNNLIPRKLLFEPITTSAKFQVSTNFPTNLKSVKCSGSERTIAVAVTLGLETLLVRPDREVHVGRAVVVPGGGLHHLIRGPSRVFLGLSPDGKTNVVLRVLGVVLGHDDGVAPHLAVLVREVVLSVSDGDGVHGSGDLGWINILGWHRWGQYWHLANLGLLRAKANLGLCFDLESVFFTRHQSCDGPLGL